MEQNYNPNNHNHIEWSDDKLQSRLNELHENNRLVGYTGERREQVMREMNIIAFEIAERVRESKNESIEQAWGDCGA